VLSLHVQAAKSANAELRGNYHYQNVAVTDLYVPLQIFLDYLGFRVLATAVVPINIVKRSDSGRVISRGEFLLVNKSSWITHLF
jgi:hypothetical protein